MKKKSKGKRAKEERTHIEISFETPIIWPKVAWEVLENQVKTELRKQIRGRPEEGLWFLMESALDDMLLGLREITPGKEVILHSQTLEIQAYVVDSRDGKPVRRRRLSNLKPIEVVWPYAK